MSDQQIVKDWMQKFGQDCPLAPCIPSAEVRKLRAKLILEEAVEACIALGIGSISNSYGFVICLEELQNELHAKDVVLNDELVPNLEAIADGCADLRVVTVGTEVACGIPGDKTFAEVMRSNDSKLWDNSDVLEEFSTSLAQLPEWQRGQVNHIRDGEKEASYIGSGKWLVKDKDGKVKKSPSYSPANLKPILETTIQK